MSKSLILHWYVIAPFDETSKVYVCKGNKYRCKNTGKYFNCRTGTIFDNTKLPLQKWFMALYIFSSHKKGISSHQLAKDLDITQKSAWFVLHRLRYAFDHPAFREIMGGDNGSGIAEADETYMGGKISNKTKKQKAAIENKYSRALKTPVIGIIERNGNITAKVFEVVNRQNACNFIAENLKHHSVIVTDSAGCYQPLQGLYSHQVVNHAEGEYYKNGFHTNSIEGFWSHLKRGVYGIYHHVSPEHLQKYVNEFTLRYNTRKHQTCNRFDLILSNIAGRKITYKQLINHE